MKKISIVMASYNGESFIRQQIQSIISQMSADDELIISDDGSTDQTVAIIKSFLDQRIKTLVGPHNGVIKNFEFALQHTNGDIIILADQDDIWLDSRILNIRNYFNNTIENAVYISRYTAIDADEKIISIQTPKFDAGLIKNIIRNRYIGSMMAFSSSLKNQILPFPRYIAMHDQWIGLVNEMLNGELAVSNEPEVLYRRHGQNLTGIDKKISVTKRLTNRLFLVYYLLKKHLSIQREDS